MNKYIVGSILSLFSLLVIYGARSSGRVVNWVDGNRTAESTPAQADLVSNNGTNQQLVAQTDTENMTPLQKAGTLPQRQTFAEGAQADSINVPAASDTAATPTQTTTTAQQTTPAQPATTAGQGVTDSAPAARTAQPVRALW